AADFSFHADVSIEVDADAGAKTVVAEARSLRVLAFGEERRTARNDRDDDGARSGDGVLCVRLTGSSQSDHCEHHCDPTSHVCLLFLSDCFATFARGGGDKQSGRSASGESLLRYSCGPAEGTMRI